MRQRAVLWLLLALIGLPLGTAAGALDRLFGSGPADGQDEILEPDRAFILSLDDSNPARPRLHWEIADNYYLYRDKFRVTSSSDTVAVGELHIPAGEIEDDPEFGQVTVHRDEVEIIAPLSRAAAEPGQFDLQVTYQGCKQDAVCYPPITKSFSMSLAPIQTAQAAPGAGEIQSGGSAGATPLSAQDAITRHLQSGGLWLNVAAFFGFGLLLAFTPCVFPMIPILSGLIVGQSGHTGRQITAGLAFMLSLAYVLAMALTYAVLGVIAGSFGFNLQAASQNAWAIGAFSAVFVLLALSMFGFYDLQLPSALQSRLQRLGNSQHAGSLWGAAVMGAVSAVIVGPCVAPPLAGALLYISQTGNALLGGSALFAMGLGFGVPLLVIGASAGRLLPAAGGWMETIKQVFGVIMLGVAIWFLERILPAAVSLMLWALLLIVSAVCMGALDRLDSQARWRRLWKGLGLALLVYGIVLIIGAVSGGQDPLRPLEGSRLLSGGTQTAESQQVLSFTPVKTVADVREALLQASLEGRPVMLDFYADWCVVCQELERYTFRDPAVHRALQEFVLLKADVTANDAEDRALLEKYELFGPPAMLFFDPDTRELRRFRLVGFIEARDFVGHVESVRDASS